jgi:hypothetical protein
MAEAVYLLCAITSLLCAGLLLRSYRAQPMTLTLWTVVCFVGLAANNVLLFVDLVIVAGADLRTLRNLAGFAGVALLLYGMITLETS